MMNVAIRVDASIKIGTGHVIRCLTLADELQRHGAYVRFLAKQMPSALRDMILLKGHDFRLLSSNLSNQQIDELKHSEWLGTSQANDAQESISELADRNWDWLIVDHYALDFRWESKLRNITQNLMVVDDLADRNHDCTLLVDQNFYIDMEHRYADKVPKDCQLLLGPKYALLKREFLDARQRTKNKTGVVHKVLVFFGGVDAQNYTQKAIEALSELTEYHFQVDVVIGAVHPNKDKIITLCDNRGYRCHVQTNKMSDLILNADLAIGAGGISTWERCCLGLPSLVIATAENQIKQLRDMASIGSCYLIDNPKSITESFRLHISALLENSYLLNCIAVNCKDLVDGLGAGRLINKLLISKVVKVRLVTKQDERNIYEWRNHPSIRACSRNQNVLEWESHQGWFQKALQNQDIIMLIAERSQTPIGVIRYDVQGEQAEVSIYLIQNENNKGLGSAVLECSEIWIKSNRPDLKRLNANVLVNNYASHRLFEKASYQLESLNYTKVLN